jgi:hypothetical protein
MNIEQTKREEFKTLSKELIRWLNENCHPHCEIRIDNQSAELLEGQFCVRTMAYIKD